MKKRRYISLTDSDYILVESAYKSSTLHHYREKCHAIMLSHAKYTIGELAQMFKKQEDTIRGWFNRWEADGLKGFAIQEGRGVKPKLSLNNPELVELVKKKSKNNP
jgi:transposase